MCQLAVIMIMEYVPEGKDLEHIDNLDTLFKKDKATSQQIFREIGKLVMLDALINNTDRFPVIWRHKGNIGNILFTSNPTSPVVGIDQTVTANKLENSVSYMYRVRLLLEQIIGFGLNNVQTFCVDLCREYIRVKRSYDVGRFGLRQMWIGLMQGICQICTHITLEKITQSREKIATTVKKVSSMMESPDPSGWGLERVRIEFLSTTLGLMNEYHERVVQRLEMTMKEEDEEIGEDFWKEFLDEEGNMTAMVDEAEWLKKKNAYFVIK